MEQTLATARRVAFFGGSFDPPHEGHLAVARAAQKALHLDRVLFAPVGAQPLKPMGSTASFDDRLAMTQLAISGDPGFDLSLIDAPKPNAAPNFTIDTLLQLRQKLPADGVLFFLMGADSFLSLARWHKAAEIPFVAQLIVAARPEQPLNDVKALLPHGVFLQTTPNAVQSTVGPPSDPAEVNILTLRNSHGATNPFFVLPDLHVEISASQIREDVRDLLNAADSVGEGRPPTRNRLVPATVLEYIRAHGLYR